MRQLLISLYHNPILTRLFPTLVSCLQRQLADCQTVLDLGCGADSPLQYCKNISYSVGVEPFKPYLLASKKKKIHDKYINKKIEELNFPAKSFDAVIMIEVLEHLPKNLGSQVLKNAEKWAKKKIIVTTPNGFVEQGGYDNNPYQKHLSGWDFKKMKDLGFNTYGLAGLKFLREKREVDTKDADLMTSIRLWPKPFWFVVAVLSQIITYRLPKLAFGLFCVKRLKNKKTK